MRCTQPNLLHRPAVDAGRFHVYVVVQSTSTSISTPTFYRLPQFLLGSLELETTNHTAKVAKDKDELHLVEGRCRCVGESATRSAISAPWSFYSHQSDMASTGQQPSSTSSEHSIQTGPFPIRSAATASPFILWNAVLQEYPGPAGLTPDNKSNQKKAPKLFMQESPVLAEAIGDGNQRIQSRVRQKEVNMNTATQENLRVKRPTWIWDTEAVYVSHISKYMPLVHRTHMHPRCKSSMLDSYLQERI